MPYIVDWFDKPGIAPLIRKSRVDVEKYVTLAEVIKEAQKRGWHVLEFERQIIVLKRGGTIQIHC